MLSAFMWEAPILRCFPLDTLYSPEGMQCVLKKIMNCREVPYSLITKKPRHIHNLSAHGLVADFIISEEYTTCHPGILTAFMWEALIPRRFPLTSSPCEASPMYSSPFVIWPPDCVQALLPPASVSYPAYSGA